MRPFIGLLVWAALGGCNVVGDVYGAHLETFVPKDFAWSLGAGANAIVGRASADGTTYGPGHCTGEAILIPDGSYVERNTGHVPEFALPAATLADRSLAVRGPILAPEAGYLLRRTPCDAQGRFAFTGLPDGPYLVYAPAAEREPYLRKRVRVSGGRTVTLDLVETCKNLPHRKRIGGFAQVCGVAPLNPRPPPGDPNF